MDNKEYKNLLKKLKAQLDQVEKLVSDDTNRVATMEALWGIGRDIYDFTNKTGMNVRDVALDIGASPGSLQKYVRFYKCYPKGYKTEYNGKPVSLSHYIAVIYQNDPKVREFYLKEAALQEWSSHELRRRVRNNYYETRQEFVDAKSHSKADLGEKHQNLFTYGAEVLKIIDADTLELNIDVGFKTWMRHKVRLRGINCPEVRTRKGEEAKAFVMKELGALGTNVVIRSYKSGKFGRYIVDLWYLPGETNREVILEKGLLLNQVLLDKGLARKVE